MAAELHVLLCDTATWSTLLCGALRAFLDGWRAHALDRFMLTHICTHSRASHGLGFLPTVYGAKQNVWDTLQCESCLCRQVTPLYMQENRVALGQACLGMCEQAGIPSSEQTSSCLSTTRGATLMSLA